MEPCCPSGLLSNPSSCKYINNLSFRKAQLTIPGYPSVNNAVRNDNKTNKGGYPGLYSQRERRRIQYRAKVAAQTPAKKKERQAQNRAAKRKWLAKEDKTIRLNDKCLYMRDKRANEDDTAKKSRLFGQRVRNKKKSQQKNVQFDTNNNKDISQMISCAVETPEHNTALEDMPVIRKSGNESIEQFKKAINVFADKWCEVCFKMCYPSQLVKFNMPETPLVYLSDELKAKPHLILCHTCKKYLSDKKKKIFPAKAYWNDLNPGIIPEEFNHLTKSEIGLLTRIEPYIKIIKFTGRLGQYGCKGLATLFAKDIFEVTDKIDLLPRSTKDANLIIVCEEFENLNISKEYSVDRTRVMSALQWLKLNNALYKDVVINNNADLDVNHMMRVAQPEEEETIEEIVQEIRNHYKQIGKNSRILRASFHQGQAIFHSGYEGRQCCAMAAAAITKAQLLSPQEWTTLILDTILMYGDSLYSEIRVMTPKDHPIDIPENDYLLVRNFDVIKNDYQMFGNNSFSMQYAEDPEIYGTLDDKNERDLGWNLVDGLNLLFQEHSAGILIAQSKSYAVMKIGDVYYFADSHASGEKGCRAKTGEGKACIIECDTIEEFVRIIKRTFGSAKSRKDAQYTLDYLDIHHKVEAIAPSGNLQEMRQASEQEIQRVATMPMQVQLTLESAQVPKTRQYHDEVQNTAMMNCDYPQPDVEDEFTIQGQTIIRKTKDNFVNINVEKKAEEFAWWHLFPYGINGLNQERRVKMTPLQYFQFRILGKDKRFWDFTYLFYALAIYEYLKMQSSVNLCGKRIYGSHGPPNDVHTYLKKMRGTGAYWNTACHELCDIIKAIGPPHYFVTFSCNDLNWKDMRKALLIADGRLDVDPNDIEFNEAQRLIEKYPVVVARHFNHRLQKTFKFMRDGKQIFGGNVLYFWYRVEFQLRGSAHPHILIWVENHPLFNTPDGIARINKVVTCKLPPKEENEKLYELVDKLQRHKHTHTCYKGEFNKTRCRFRFPRPVSTKTRLLAQDSNEFIQNGGRICILERSAEEKNINNYNPELLEATEANMDIQVCGSDDAIAYYIAKYVAKAEPTDLDRSIRQAINQIRQEESNITKKMFKICHRIMKERQVSAIEAAYRLCGLKMRDSNITTVFVNTRQEQDRYRLIKKGSGNGAAGYCTNIFDRYQMRPRVHPDYDFENMSLIEFAMHFDPYYQKNDDGEGIENVDSDIDLQEEYRQKIRLITLTDKSKMKIRNKKAVVRVPRLNSNRDSESYYYSLLLQYKPYWVEMELLQGFETAKEAFLACEEELRRKSTFMETYRRRDKELENALAKAHAVVVFEECEPTSIEEIGEEIDLNGQALMNNEQYEQAMSALNVQQTELMKIVTDSILEQLEGSKTRFKIFLTGNAGCGKTFTMKAAQNQIIRICGNDPSVVKLCALTGVAAVLINGTTIHSLLRLPVQKDGRTTGFMPLSGVVLRMKRLEWKNVKVLIIDEVSMISYEMLTMIESRCRQIMNNENELFGGLNILLCGDLLQLPPIRGNQIFDQPKRMEAQINLWRQFRLCELVENMRQKGDQTFINILNALRVGELKLNQLEDLMTRVGTNDTNMSGEFDNGKALRIYPTNKQVTDHNNLIIEKFKQEGMKMFTIKAQDNITSGDFTKEQTKAKISDDINKTAGLPTSLTIFVGAKVMLRSNVDVSKKLVNGSIGYITEIIWPHFRRDQMYEDDIPKVKVKFDGGVGEHIIEPITKEFQAKGNVTAERHMLPMVLSWASTGHKLQGSTLDYAVVCLQNMFAAGLAYVILSRVKSLAGLRIESIDLAQLVGKKPCNEAAKQELDRMRNENKKSSNK